MYQTKSDRLVKGDTRLIVAAAKPFRGFNPEAEQAVREQKVTPQSNLDVLRKRREALRAMDPGDATTLIEFVDHIDFFEALELAKKTNRILIPNSFFDKVIFGNCLAITLVRTGTLIIYEAPDTPFGAQVVHSEENSIKFAVPTPFQGLVNCALVVEYPDFELVRLGNDKIEVNVHDERNVYLLKDFPKHNGYYHYDPCFLIPRGEEIAITSPNDSIRRLMRRHNANINLVSRYVNFDITEAVYTVYVDYLMFDRFGVTLF